MYDKNNKIWHMWYASYRYRTKKEPWPHCKIRYAKSEDGIKWHMTGEMYWFKKARSSGKALCT